MNERRLHSLVAIATAVEGSAPGPLTHRAVQNFEPYVPWNYDFLLTRLRSYVAANDRLALAAGEDLETFLTRGTTPFAVGIGLDRRARKDALGSAQGAPDRR